MRLLWMAIWLAALPQDEAKSRVEKALREAGDGGYAYKVEGRYVRKGEYEATPLLVSRIRSYIKGVETAIASGDKDAAQTALRAAQPEIMRGVTKGVIHRNQAARKISRLSARIQAI